MSWKLYLPQRRGASAEKKNKKRSLRVPEKDAGAAWFKGRSAASPDAAAPRKVGDVACQRRANSSETASQTTENATDTMNFVFAFTRSPLLPQAMPGAAKG